MGRSSPRRGALRSGADAGLEKNILAPNAPRVVKDPYLSTRLRPLLEEGKVAVEHAIVPMRDLDVASASRVRASGYGGRPGAWGGLFGTPSSRNSLVLTRPPAIDQADPPPLSKGRSPDVPVEPKVGTCQLTPPASRFSMKIIRPLLDLRDGERYPDSLRVLAASDAR